MTTRPQAFDAYDDHDDHAHTHISFSGTEVFHLVISVLVLSLAFTFALGGMALLGGEPVDVDEILEILPFAAAIVVSSFVLHELAHKVVAQRRALWAEYRSSYVGLAVGLALSALSGIVLAAPGAVHIYGRATDRDSGVISLVGPLVNLALGFLAYPFAFSSTGEAIKVGAAGNLLELVVFINAALALFNMIPVRPLDGSKIWTWSKTAYFVTIALCAYLFYLYFRGATPGLF